MSESEIIAELWDRSPNRWTVALARHMLKVRLSKEQESRLVTLVRKNRTGGLTPAEVEEMDAHLRVGDLLAVLQSKARQFLKRRVDDAIKGGKGARAPRGGRRTASVGG
jgi:hypothetical protein